MVSCGGPSAVASRTERIAGTSVSLQTSRGLWGQGPARPVGGSPEVRERLSLPRHGRAWGPGLGLQLPARDKESRANGAVLRLTRCGTGWVEGDLELLLSAPSRPSLFVAVSVQS